MACEFAIGGTIFFEEVEESSSAARINEDASFTSSRDGEQFSTQKTPFEANLSPENVSDQS
jgi:hypothetical protein